MTSTSLSFLKRWGKCFACLAGILVVMIGFGWIPGFRNGWQQIEERDRAIGDWIGFYNHQRPHQALAMRTPAEAYALAA